MATSGNDEVAPIPAIRATMTEPPESFMTVPADEPLHRKADAQIPCDRAVTSCA
jgi:hypothetical protein